MDAKKIYMSPELIKKFNYSDEELEYLEIKQDKRKNIRSWSLKLYNVIKGTKK
jgi:hypothetical protein